MTFQTFLPTPRRCRFRSVRISLRWMSMRRRSPCWLKCGSESTASVFFFFLVGDDILWCLKHYMLNCGYELGFLCVCESLLKYHVYICCVYCIDVFTCVSSIEYLRYWIFMFSSSPPPNPFYLFIFILMNTMKMCREGCYKKCDYCLNTTVLLSVYLDI